MKGFVEVTQEVNPYLTEPSFKDIGGRPCTKKHKSTSRSVTNARDLPQTFINQGESLISVQPLAICSMGLGYCRVFP